MKMNLHRTLPLRGLRQGAAVLVLGLVCGCSALQPLTAPSEMHFSLTGEPGGTPVVAPASATLAAAPATGLTMIVNPPHAAAGFDSQRIVYLRQPNKPEFFAYSDWVDTPARMLAPLVVTSLARSGAFRAVIPGPSTAAGDLRLDMQILRLQQEFLQTPSQVRFALRVHVTDNATRQVLATRDFEASAPASGENAYGGVQAANQAVQSVLGELAAFCAQVAREAPPRDPAIRR
jgi:cholesterol transport system auxiliary component